VTTHEEEGELYWRCVRLTEKATRLWLAGREKSEPAPAFRLPTEPGCAIGACIDQIPIAKNGAARELVDVLCMVTRTVGPDRQPTIEMLRVILQNVGIAYECAPLAEFGRFVQMGRGGTAS
jgi:hypothetical protein